MPARLFLVQQGTEGDTRNDLSITVENIRATYLSDFIGGRATFTEGYTGYMTTYEVQECSFDDRRLDLIPHDESKFTVTVHPVFTRNNDNSLQAVPLMINQQITIQFGENGLGLDFRIQNFQPE